MEIVLTILGTTIAIILVVILVQANRKLEYAKSVYLELDKAANGEQLKYIMKHHFDEDLRLEMATLQFEILRRGYTNNLAPSDAAFAMSGALQQLLNEYEPSS